MDTNNLPRYLYNENKDRFWLTISSTINGDWCVGYCSTAGEWLEKPRLTSETIEDGLKELRVASR